MADKANESVDSIVAQALKEVGVASKDINLTPEPEPGETPPLERKTKLDGSLKGQTKGELTDDEGTQDTDEPTPDEPESDVQPEQSLSKADITALVDQASSKFQSLMDRKINTLTSQMQQQNTMLSQFFEIQDNTALAGLPPEEQVLKRLERLEGRATQPAPQVQPSQSGTQQLQMLVNLVDAVGLKADDSRIDWAPDVTDPQAGMNRFITSIKAAMTEDRTKAIQELKDNGNKEIQKIRKKVGIDKVSTTGAGGAGLPNIEKMTPFQKLEYAFNEAEIANKT